MSENKDLLDKIYARLDSFSYIKSESIPNIDLYMDQVTGFMDEHLGDFKRYNDDKALTKTMINNYTKNRLLPPPDKKKYSKEHILLLVFIYYYKNILSFTDIEAIFAPITQTHFNNKDEKISLSDIYDEVFALESGSIDNIKSEISVSYDKAMASFSEADEEDREYLTLFAFLCNLAFDVYLKKQVIEQIADTLIKEQAANREQKKSRNKIKK